MKNTVESCLLIFTMFAIWFFATHPQINLLTLKRQYYLAFNDFLAEHKQNRFCFNVKENLLKISGGTQPHVLYSV